LVTIKRAALESSVSESPDDGNLAHLLDRSTFEQCGDFWTFPKSADPRIVLDFDDTPVRRVGILNSFGEPESASGTRSPGLPPPPPPVNEAGRRVGLQATRSLRLSLRLKGELVLEQDVSLQRFPRWTWIEFPRRIHADRIDLSMLSGDGEKVSLNEVLIER
jgi:hypothetical protein